MGVLSVGVGLFGNEEVTSGSRPLLGSLRQMGHRIMEAKTKVESTAQDAKDRDDANKFIRSILDKLDGFVKA